MHIKKVILILGVVYLIHLSFKLWHLPFDVYRVNNFTVENQLNLGNGKIVIGRNIMGIQEAIFFPDTYAPKAIDSLGIIDYVYLRFHPDWFNKYLSSKLKETNNPDETLLLAKAIHKANFHNYMHSNDYPIPNENYMPVVIKVKEFNKKHRFAFTRSKESHPFSLDYSTY